MALVDFIPVILFAISSVILQRDLYNKMSKGAFALFAAGTIDIAAAGYADGLARSAFLPLAKIAAKRYNQMKQGLLTRPPGRELNFNVVMTLQ